MEPSTDTAASAPTVPDRSRRHLLSRGAAAAAGAVAGGVLASGGVADAANGDAIKIGNANIGSATTKLTGSRFEVANGNNGTSIKATHDGVASSGVYSVVTGNESVAVLGVASGSSNNDIGVRGQGKTGVVGDGNFAGGVGVRGYGPTALKGVSPANNGIAVHGEAQGANSTGVVGMSPSVGVFGEGELFGVAAFSNSGIALDAHSDGSNKPALVAETGGSNGTAIHAIAGWTAKAGVDVEAASGAGVQIKAETGPALRLAPGPAMPPTTGSWQPGDVVMHEGLWLCLTGGVGTQSRWIKLSRAYQPLDAPVRIYDSRPGYAPANVTKGKIPDGGERVIDCTQGGAVPAGIASAVEVNVTVTDTSSGGWLSLFSNAVPWPGTSTINWFQTGMTIANGTTVAVDDAARFRIRGAGSTHVVVDVTGYYT